VVTGLAALVAGPVLSQETFRLDTTFRTEIQRKYVNSLLPTSDGKLIVSGVMRFPGEFSDKRLVRLLPDGSRDPTFNNSGLGGGKITPWQDQFYVNAGLVRRILLPSGDNDQTFRLGYSQIPYFSVLQGGDYHVFPDGRVLLTGEYMLSDSVRGFEGVYDLVWITNTGYLDTTRVHRQSNGTMWDLAELPDGEFICSCSCSQYESHAVDRIFRVEADGALDTTFHTGVYTGIVHDYYPLADGRVLVGGNYRRSAAPEDTLYLARFLPDGSLDPDFNIPHFGREGGNWYPNGTAVLDVFPFGADRFIVAGQFTTVNGSWRKGICMLDSSGALLPAFDTCGVGPYTYMSTTNAAITNVYWNSDSTALYICGTYVGYDDGSTNDTLQRFVSRLYVVEDTTTGITSASPTNTTSHYTILPNPARGWAAFNYDRKEVAPHDGTITVRDVTGKAVASLPMQGAQGQQVWDTRHVAPGIYLVEFRSGSQLLHTEKLIVQQ
jgi:uncharacterized delta-60 repeat protein